MLSRRTFTLAMAAGGLSGCVGAPRPDGLGTASTVFGATYSQIYGPIDDEPYPIAEADLSRIDPRYLRRIVDYRTSELPGTVIVDVDEFFLYLVSEDSRAIRYGVGLGREGFAWSGTADILMKRRWPTWTPPAEMIEREPELAQYRDGMAPGLENPLGARALYLFQDGLDTLYRLHGTGQEWSIGKAVSSGCVRLLNHDVIDLYRRVPTGSRVIVTGTGSSAVG